MNKSLFFVSVILIMPNLFSQLTLEHSYSHTEFARLLYIDSSNTNYIYFYSDNIIKIYDESHGLYKSLNVPVNSDYSFLGDNYLNQNFQVSKYVFNEDDKLEFALPYSNSDTNETVLLIFNEDGTIIHEFGDEYWWSFEVFHDFPNNQNKFLITKVIANDIISEVYLLPTTILTTKEIQSKDKLNAFPIPVENKLNIINPMNGVNRVTIFDMNGALIRDYSFDINSKVISLDLSSLPKGTYIYIIGGFQSKILKK